MAEILAVVTVQDGWARFMTAQVRLDDGTTVSRQLEAHGKAVAVLPYDAKRHTAVLVELFRTPVLFSGAGETLIECIAGIVEEGEAAQTSARREALEEAGLKLDALEPVATLWTSPGISTETIALFLAPYAQPDRVGPGGGAAGEHENITVLEQPLGELWRMFERGVIADMKTAMLLQALRLRRPELFEEPV